MCRYARKFLSTSPIPAHVLARLNSTPSASRPPDLPAIAPADPSGGLLHGLSTDPRNASLQDLAPGPAAAESQSRGVRSAAAALELMQPSHSSSDQFQHRYRMHMHRALIV